MTIKAIILKYIHKMRVTFFIVLTLFGCTAKQSAQDGKLFSKGINKGIIDVRLMEASGLVESIDNPGYLWSLNDSGNPAEVFLIDTSARIKLVCKLNVKNRDWEDITIGAGPKEGKKYVYVGDIGDNLGAYDYKYIYRFEEPSLKDGAEQTITHFDALVIKLPGKNRDSETIMIDPTNNDFYLISKREKHVHVYLQHFPYPDTLRPLEVLKIPFTRIVAGSISPDAKEVLLKDYENIYYWKRSGEKSLIELLAKAPAELSYKPEAQGESICWNHDASGYYTLSESHEGKMAQLKFYKRK